MRIFILAKNFIFLFIEFIIILPIELLGSTPYRLELFVLYYWYQRCDELIAMFKQLFLNVQKFQKIYKNV